MSSSQLLDDLVSSTRCGRSENREDTYVKLKMFIRTLVEPTRGYVFQHSAFRTSELKKLIEGIGVRYSLYMHKMPRSFLYPIYTAVG
jgi:hypothetical protein